MIPSWRTVLRWINSFFISWSQGQDAEAGGHNWNVERIKSGSAETHPKACGSIFSSCASTVSCFSHIFMAVNCYFGQRVVSKQPMNCIDEPRQITDFVYRQRLSFSPHASYSSHCSLLICMKAGRVWWPLGASGWQPWLHPLAALGRSWRRTRSSWGHCPPAAGPQYANQQMPSKSCPSLLFNLDTGLMQQATWHV